MTRKKTPSQPHATETIPLKFAAVDRGIIPVVRWLNSFDGVFTLYSCEGDTTQGKDRRYPYILFLCLRGTILDEILDFIGRSGGWRVEVDRYEEQRRYLLRFDNQSQMQLFIREYLED